jgi:ubiquinone/menaquinone biosynthesis C-methylase UbiE
LVFSVLSRGSSFASWASGYDDSALQRVLFEPVHCSVLEQLRLHASGAASLLDVGCGTGRLLRLAAQFYPLAVGLDPCLDMIEAGRRRDPSASPLFVCGVAERLPFPTGTFDVVTSTLSLRHWQDPMSGLRELARVLSEAGTLVIADAQPSPWPAPRHRFRRRRGSGGPLELLAIRCGLEIVDQGVAPSLFAVQVLTARHLRALRPSRFVVAPDT